MKLVIVESPTKARTISSFLGRDFTIESSYGHVRDLPKGELGIDIEHDFKPRYVIPKKAEKRLNQLKKTSQSADRIILATDEDREGEAIAWHLTQALGLSNPQRIVFHEITKPAVNEALKNPRGIDMDLVYAQQARRVLDRLVGYKLSPFLWKKLRSGLSAGRVQSVALRLIVEREEEIKNFKPQDYWKIIALLQNQNKDEWAAELIKINGEAIAKPGLTNKKKVKEIMVELKKSQWSISSIEKKAREQRPQPPFTTSTLQQAAWQKLKFSSKKTMMIAQRLYETGHITYMRTDSLNVSESALQKAADYLKKKLGEKYSLATPRKFKTKSKGAQEAHESIRPTKPQEEPEAIKKELNSEQYKLYQLVWKRFIASQMPNAIFEDTIINTQASSPKNNYLFYTKGSILKFDGFLKIYDLAFTATTLPPISQKDKVLAKEIKPEKHQTTPPPRFNDASLVKTLEKEGIGRPSTYAQIISTLLTRNYVERDNAKRFVPTEMGEIVNKILVKHFPKIVDLKFTAKMENELDEIAEGKKEYAPIISQFYEPFEKNLEEKYKTVKKLDLTEKTDEICEVCGKPMVIKYGRFGKFMACSGFPECKNTKPLPPKELDIKCPLCKKGNIIERKTKKGKIFYGCSEWPNCKFATWQKPTGKLCPDCGSPLVELKSEIKCSNKTCDYTSPLESRLLGSRASK